MQRRVGDSEIGIASQRRHQQSVPAFPGRQRNEDNAHKAGYGTHSVPEYAVTVSFIQCAYIQILHHFRYIMS